MMSDGEATGGEMSEGGKKKRLKLRLQGSPNASRAGSPAPGRNGSRAASPQAPGMFSLLGYVLELMKKGGSRTPTNPGPISAEELKAAIPPTGITIQDLMKIFSNRIGDPKDNKTDRKDFIQMVKVNSEYGADKLLKAKASAPPKAVETS